MSQNGQINPIFWTKMAKKMDGFNLAKIAQKSWNLKEGRHTADLNQRK